MTTINAQVVADSLSPQGDRLISVLATFPRIILAEVNTHRMLSKNTSSSRAIPFTKMVEAVQNDPFIPIAFQKAHKGMQGTEYFTDKVDIEFLKDMWLSGLDYAVQQAKAMNNPESFTDKKGLTKQLCNRLLEPFMWTTMLITGSKEGWDNFFSLRCPKYYGVYKSQQELLVNNVEERKRPFHERPNEAQAEIHMQMLAEEIYDAVNKSTPKQLQAGEWHIPFEDKIDLIDWLDTVNNDGHLDGDLDEQDRLFEIDKVKISTAMSARTSYTVVGDEKEVDYSKMIELHDRLIAQDPPHSSPMEHCSQCVTQEEYDNSYKGKEKGWFRNYKGFKSYRQIIEDN